jgi:hypothetical protein
MLISLLVGNVLAKKCLSDDNKYIGKSAAIQQEIQHYPNNPNVNITVSGTIRVIDGCTFTVEDFVFLPGFTDTLWYGRKNDDKTHAMIVSNTPVASSDNSSFTFTMTTTPGAEMSWDDMDTLVLFSRENKFEMAIAKLDFVSNNDSPVTSTPSNSSTSNIPASSDAHSIHLNLSTNGSFFLFVVCLCFLIM